jgi:pyruvate formate lyase activating enzyme
MYKTVRIMKKHAMLYIELKDKKVHCNLCTHRCKIAESKFGICGVRQNINGELYTHVYGKVIASHVDPIEKKPLFHFLPKTKSYSIATPGCNFKCSFCQNWQISQYRSNQDFQYEGLEMTPEEIVKAAKLNNCQSIAYTYTEPTIFFEYAYDTAKLAKKQNLSNIIVTNGYLTKEAIETIAPYLDAANIDLKSFRDDFYKKICGARLQPVLNTIKTMYEKKIWLEITTLVVPEQNDSKKELNDIAKFIAEVDKKIPWHITRFHPEYKYTDAEPTPIETLQMAEEIGRKHGLKYIHLGNVLL